MRAHRGVTLIEIMIVVSIVGIMAAIAIPQMTAARRNASVASAGFELGVWLDGLKTRALRDQRDLVAVFRDVPANDASACAGGDDSQCAGYFAIRAPPAFTLNNFDPSASVSGIEVIERRQLPRGVKFYRAADGRGAPRPFETISLFLANHMGICAGNRACMAVRFRGDGQVERVLPTITSRVVPPGIAIAIAGEQSADHRGSDQRGVLVTFPTGLVKAFAVAR